MSKLLKQHPSIVGARWQPRAIISTIIEAEMPPDYAAISADVRRKAEEEACAIREAARIEAEIIRKSAHDQGHAEGKFSAERSLDEKIASLDSLVEDINRERESFFDTAEPELVRLAVAIAEKVLAQQLSMKPEIIVDMTRTYIKRIRDREVLRIRVNPDDLPLLAEARQTLMNEIDGVREIQLFEDRRVGRSGIVIESEGGSLDARLATQIDVVKSSLNEAVQGSRRER